MDMKRLISLSFALVMAVYAGGQALAEEPTPMPVPPPVQRPEALPRPPDVQTFAVCGAGTTCDCDNVVSVAQARDGNRVPSHRAQARARFNRGGMMWGCVVSAGREPGRSGESRPRMVSRSRLNWRALGAGQDPASLATRASANRGLAGGSGLLAGRTARGRRAVRDPMR